MITFIYPSGGKIMVDFLFFALASIGMTHIVVDSHIMSFFRKWVKNIFPENISKIVDCYQCSGMWCGFICSLMIFETNIFTVILSGCISSFLAQWAAAYLNSLEAKSVVVE